MSLKAIQTYWKKYNQSKFVRKPVVSLECWFLLVLLWLLDLLTYAIGVPGLRPLSLLLLVAFIVRRQVFPKEVDAKDWKED